MYILYMYLIILIPIISTFWTNPFNSLSNRKPILRRLLQNILKIWIFKNREKQSGRVIPHYSKNMYEAKILRTDNNNK